MPSNIPKIEYCNVFVSLQFINFFKIIVKNIRDILKYENAAISHKNMKTASIRWKNFPNIIFLVNKYIDINSSL